MGYILGRGDVFIGDRDANGNLLAGFRFHCPSFELEGAAEYAEHKNSTGAVKVLDARVIVEQMPKLTFSVDTKDPSILAMALGGKVFADAGTTFSAKAFPSGLTVGSVVPIPGGFRDLTSLVVIDSNGTPATLALGTNYTVDLVNGLITFINLASFTQPFKSSGVTNAGKITSVGTETTTEKFIRFNGIDIADGNKPIVCDVYRAQIPPTKFPVKTDGNDFVKFDFAPVLLADINAPFAGAYGPYGNVRMA